MDPPESVHPALSSYYLDGDLAAAVAPGKDICPGPLGRDKMAHQTAPITTIKVITESLSIPQVP